MMGGIDVETGARIQLKIDGDRAGLLIKNDLAEHLKKDFSLRMKIRKVEVRESMAVWSNACQYKLVLIQQYNPYRIGYG